MTNASTRSTRHIKENIKMHLIPLYTMVRESLETSMHVTTSQINSDGVQPDVKHMKASDVSCSVREQDICNYDFENRIMND